MGTGALGGLAVAAQAGRQVGTIAAAAFVDGGNTGRGATPQRAEEPDSQRKSDYYRKQQSNNEWKLGNAEQVCTEEYAGGKGGDQYQPRA